MAEPPIALVHGWGGSFAASFAACGWPQLVQAAGRRLIGVTLPGHGPEPAPHAPEAYADLTSGLAARLPDEPVDAIGFSLGGKLLLALALRAPQRFRRLVIGGVGDNVFSPEQSAEPLAQALESGTPPAALAPLLAPLMAYVAPSRSHALALAAVLRRPPNPLVTPAQLHNLVPELRLINGSADAIAIPDAALRAALPRCDYISLPAVTHLPLPAHPQFQRLALAFCAAP